MKTKATYRKSSSDKTITQSRTKAATNSFLALSMNSTIVYSNRSIRSELTSGSSPTNIPRKTPIQIQMNPVPCVASSIATMTTTPMSVGSALGLSIRAAWARSFPKIFRYTYITNPNPRLIYYPKLMRINFLMVKAIKYRYFKALCLKPKMM